MFGTGIWEHKGGLVVLLAALQALRFTRILKKTKIGILLTTDDSLQGKFAKAIVNKKAQRAKYVIGMHGASQNGGVIISRSGAAVYRCNMNLMRTDNASDVATATSIFTKLVNSWIDLSEPEEGLVVSPSNLIINSNITQPYAHGEVSLSIRFNKEEQINKIDEKIRKQISKKYRDLLHFQIEGGVRRPPMMFTEHIEQLWKLTKKIATSLDIQLRKEHRWSSADICFVDDKKPIIDGLGPVGTKPVKKSEYILRYSILERATLLAITISKLTIQK